MGRFCALTAFLKGFSSGWWNRYTILCPCTERLHWDFSAHYLLLRWSRCLYRRALFSSLRLGIDSGLFVVNLVNLETVDDLFWCITHCTSHIIYLEELQATNALVKYLVVFNHLKNQAYSPLYLLHINHLLIPHKMVTESTKNKLFILSSFW